MFLTHINEVNLLYDVNTLLKELLNKIQNDKIKAERSQNDKNLHAATIKVVGLVSYTHITNETLIGWTQTGERMT